MARKSKKADKLTIAFVVLIVLILLFIGLLFMALLYVGYTSLFKEKPKPPDTSVVYTNTTTSSVIILVNANNTEVQENTTYENNDTLQYQGCLFPDKPHGSTICSSLNATHSEKKYIWECQNGTWVHIETCSSAANCIESDNTAICT